MNAPARGPEAAAHPRVYSVKRHGTTIAACDDEPVQTPGCVQPHGALLVLRPDSLTIAQASENADALLGTPAADLLDRPVAEVLGAAHAERLRAFVAREPLERNPLYVLTLDAPASGASGGPLDVTAHTVDGTLILELEPTGRSGSDPPDYYGLVKRAVGRLQAAPTLRAFCQVAAEEVRRASGVDRAMIYRFHPDHSGEVFAEDRREDLPGWLGMRYPAHDIPRPAREVFKQIWVRPLPDSDRAEREVAEVVPLAHPDTGAPLTMTHCALRAPSVMYTEYLRNMGVAATLTMPIRFEGELWGLIACHHYTPTALPWPARAACELLAQVTSLQLKAAEQRGDLEHRTRLDRVHDSLLRRASGGDLGALVTSAPSLLTGLDASGVAVYHGDRWWTAGEVPSDLFLDGLADWLRQRPELDPAADRPVYCTDRLAEAYPPAGAVREVASGVLAVPVSRQRRNVMLWFRPEEVQTVDWGGNPREAPTTVGPNGDRLTPRKSFELWSESVRGRSAPWKSYEVDAALRLRLLVMDLVVSHTEELASVNADLARSNEELDAFAYLASHDLKEPLRGIHKYAFQLAEDARSGAMDTKTARQRAERLVVLAERMDDLIGSLLDYSRLGRLAVEETPEDLGAVLSESLDMLGVSLEASGVEVRVPRPLPTLPADRIRVREVFANLISNAIKYRDSEEGSWVEVGHVEPEASADRAAWPLAARGQAAFYVRDNGIGLREGQAAGLFQMFKRLHPREAYGGGNGMGLAIVKKLVEQHGGTVWAEGAPGEGSTFWFTLAPGGEGA